AEQRERRAELARPGQADPRREVRIPTVDLNGVPRAKLATAEYFLEGVVERGHPWALGLIAMDIWQNLPDDCGFGIDTASGNGYLFPDLTTFRKLPWTDDVAHVLCDVYDRDGEPAATPRQVLRAVLDRAAASGHQVVFGSELEFYIFRPGD